MGAPGRTGGARRLMITDQEFAHFLVAYCGMTEPSVTDVPDPVPALAQTVGFPGHRPIATIPSLLTIGRRCDEPDAAPDQARRRFSRHVRRAQPPGPDSGEALQGLRRASHKEASMPANRAILQPTQGLGVRAATGTTGQTRLGGRS